VTTVAIIGAGPLGRRLALGAARTGYRVLLEDVMPGNLHHARESIRQELSPKALPSVAFVASIEDAVRDADLVIDCVPDELESKLEIFWLLDRMAPPRTIIATPTLQQSISDLASCTNRREKCIAISASPESLASAPPMEAQAGSPGAELILRAAPFTSDETTSLVVDFFLRLGFRPRVEHDLT
jgi:3-hydroxybutyryl-CoA dehydrogenase